MTLGTRGAGMGQTPKLSGWKDSASRCPSMSFIYSNHSTHIGALPAFQALGRKTVTESDVAPALTELRSGREMGPEDKSVWTQARSREPARNMPTARSTVLLQRLNPNQSYCPHLPRRPG